MQNKAFSFQLDESLWFKEGQGVRELLGISLEPEITIEQLQNEVRLLGTVELTGEYLPDQERTQYEEIPTVQSIRVISEVERGEEGVHYFSHSFPVEITVPNERVHDVNTVLVEIENFDYELPATNQLRLQAQMNINGIRQPKTNEIADEVESFDESTTIGPVNYQPQDTQEKPTVYQRETPLVSLNDGQSHHDADESSGRWTYKKTQTFNEFFGKEEKNEEVFQESEESSSGWEMTTVIESSSSSSIANKSTASSEEESSDEKASVHGIKQIFKHLFPNREDSYTQMKMYIVQEDETLATIAERYEISLSKLEKMNANRDSIAPGQIVYIPS
ncbi:stage VI sporulation protein D [Halobacillus rhizosphaerae]|uniref:stage VI sporulation protein D n=1 Tax=Halobacillus rhizosphaerae TaxID=3064889 RepID=UPI00398A5A42